MYSNETSGCATRFCSVSIVFCLFGFEWVTYHFTMARHPKTLDPTEWFDILVFNILFILALSSYIQTVFTDPGFVKDFKPFPGQLVVRQQFRGKNSCRNGGRRCRSNNKGLGRKKNNRKIYKKGT